MSDIEYVVIRTRKLERLLRVQYHADGKGLHQLITSCEERLPHDVIKKLRFIATVRNKTVHEDDYQLDDKKGFSKACDQCEKELTPRASRFIWGLTATLVLFVTFLAIWFYTSHWQSISF